MFSTVLSATMNGLQVEFVQVEADVSNGLPMFHLVGYLSSEVKEAGERVRAAIRNEGFVLPAKRIVVNLSPANLRKRGTIFDLGIAISTLAALECLSEQYLKDTLFVGELSLDGSVKRVSGILPIVLAAKNDGCKRCIVPRENQKEGEVIQGIQVIGVSNLREAYEIVRGEKKIEVNAVKAECLKEVVFQEDFSEIKGQYLVKRAVEIAVAGQHNLLMIGSYGAGKTAIAKRIPTILPPLTLDESIELTSVYSVIGALDDKEPLMRERPFRAVNSSITPTALLGGGVYPRPGEISLANKGVLFLDEIAEFPKALLETLRCPMEEHRIKIIREKGEYDFPAEFLLVAAMNPCPCGNYPDLNKCTCTTTQIQSYLGKLSQPFLDRIDLCVEVNKVRYEDLASFKKEESSKNIRNRIICAREIQKERYRTLGIQTNSQLPIGEVEEICKLGSEEKKLMQQAYERLNLSARSYHKVLCVARTIADLEEEKEIGKRHLHEALSYRNIDKRYWR